MKNEFKIKEVCLFDRVFYGFGYFCIGVLISTFGIAFLMNEITEWYLKLLISFMISWSSILFYYKSAKCLIGDLE